MCVFLCQSIRIKPTNMYISKTRLQFKINTLRPRQNGRLFADDIFTCIFLNENVWISVKISLKFVLKGSINKIPALVQIMAWRRPGDEPLSEPMVVRLPTHICVTRPQWVKAGVEMNTCSFADGLSVVQCHLAPTLIGGTVSVAWNKQWHGQLAAGHVASVSTLWVQYPHGVSQLLGSFVGFLHFSVP